MCRLEFGQIEIIFEGFHKQKQVTKIFIINVNKLVTSKGDLCNNWKKSWYIVSYQVDGKAIIPLFIKIAKKHT